MGSVFGGFALAGGHLAALFQPLELLMIGGAAVGAFIVSNSSKVLKATLKALPSVLKGSKYSKQRYLGLMAMLFAVLVKIRKEGMVSIEKDVDKPEESPLFGQYPELLHDHHLMEFITDYLRLMVSGNLNPHEIEALMDSEMETHTTRA
jgi:chemotaxis protein MotA